MKGNDVIDIKFSRNLISSGESMKARVKQLISESKMKPKDVRRLDEELKANWWEKNRERFLSKINRD